MCKCIPLSARTHARTHSCPTQVNCYGPQETWEKENTIDKPSNTVAPRELHEKNHVTAIAAHSRLPGTTINDMSFLARPKHSNYRPFLGQCARLSTSGTGSRHNAGIHSDQFRPTPPPRPLPQHLPRPTGSPTKQGTHVPRARA